MASRVSSRIGGSVTSVGLATAGVLHSVSGSPVTTSGTLTLNLLNQTANTVLAGPVSGGSALPSMRTLVSGDIPALDAGKITTGTIGLSRLSGLTTSQLDAAAGITSGQIASLDAGKIASGALAAARGGTGLDGSAAGNGKLLIGNGSGFTLANVSAGSGITVSNGAGSVSVGLGTHASTHLPAGSDPLDLFMGSLQTTAVETMPRLCAGGNAAPSSSGATYFTYFTPLVGATVTSVAVATGGGTQATALTHIILGIYTVDASNNLTLVAQTTDTATGLTSVNTKYVFTLNKDGAGNALANYTLSAGARYALGILTAWSSGSGPNLMCSAITAAIAALTPPSATRQTATAQTVLPTSLTYSTGTTPTGLQVYAQFS